DNLIVTAVGTAAHGEVSIYDNMTPNDPSDDRVSYSFVGYYIGTDSFSYTISDGQASATATVYVEVYDDSMPGADWWANNVIAVSSEWPGEPYDWRARQALGPPDTFEYGDIPTSWAPE